MLLAVSVVWSLGERAVSAHETLEGTVWLVLGRWVPRCALASLALGSIWMIMYPKRSAPIWIGFGIFAVALAFTYGVDYLHWYLHFAPQRAVVQ